MTKLKKYQLLEKAMRDYPVGAIIYSTSQNGTSHEVKLPYFIDECGSVQDSGQWLIYNQGLDRWAEIIPDKNPSILDGKVAIQVNNEREFKMLMEHYEGKGLVSGTGNNNICPSFPVIVPYEQSFWLRSHEDQCRTHAVIPFPDFAAEVGIKVPKFIMKSEDGVDLYEGDCYHRAYYFDNDDDTVHKGWKYDTCIWLSETHAVVTGLQQAIAFSTKDAAEAWIAEKNIRKEIIVSPESQYSISVNKEGALILCEGPNHGDNIRLQGHEIEEIYAAYKSLGGKEVENG